MVLGLSNCFDSPPWFDVCFSFLNILSSCKESEKKTVFFFFNQSKHQTSGLSSWDMLKID